MLGDGELARRLTGLLGALAMCAVGVVGTALDAGQNVPVAIPAGTSTSAAPTIDNTIDNTVDTAQRDAALREILTGRAAAVLAHDQARFMASVDGRDAAFAQRQRDVFTGMSTIPFASLEYRLVPGRAISLDEVTRRLGPTTYVPLVKVVHRIRGYDEGPVATAAALTFVRFGGRWLIAGDRDADSLLPPGSNAAPWDLGRAAVHSGRHCLVIGDAGSAVELAAVAGRVDAAVEAVSRIWPPGPGRWSGKVVVYASHDPRALSAYQSGPGDVRVVTPAALTVAMSGVIEGIDAAASLTVDDVRITGVRVIVDSAATGSDDVLRHEIVHAATMGSQGAYTPIWWTEGIAEFGALPSQEIPDYLDAAASDSVWDQLEAGTFAPELPDSATFYLGSQDEVGDRYVASYIVCRYIAAHYGRAKLLALGSTLDDINDITDAADDEAKAFRSVLHAEREDVVVAAGRWAQQLVDAAW